MDKITEIRKLPPSAVFKLSQLLDIGNAWQKVMAVIPQDPRNINSEAKYSLEHIKLIESASEKQGRSCTEILIDEWGTSGKIRPTIKTLLDVLLKAQFYRAAEYVAVELLHDSPPPRPTNGPAALVDINLPTTTSSRNEPLSGSGTLRHVRHIEYSVLERITNNFDDTLMTYVNSGGMYQRIGNKLGKGAFGTVYFGQMSNGRKVAVKKLDMNAVDTMKKQFENEIAALSEFQHENLVCLLAYSCDTENYCLVYEFMSNGSLLDRLKIKSSYNTGETNLVLNGMASNTFSINFKPLEWRKRIDIAVDICRGIHFLHTYKASPLIHRDIKTANVLLDDQLKAKVGDFGLVKVLPNKNSSGLFTSTVFGTSAYMAPETFRGDVSVKMDVFSLGVVLLELLTGLPPYDENRNDSSLAMRILNHHKEPADISALGLLAGAARPDNISASGTRRVKFFQYSLCMRLWLQVTHIQEVVEDKIEFFLDKNAGDWSVPVAEAIYQLSQECLQEKRERPFIEEVLEKLEKFQSSVVNV